MLGELWTWRRRAGVQDSIEVGAAAAPFALELSRKWRAAAEVWDDIGCPYEAALAWVETDEEPSLREALAVFQRLGAVPAARFVAQRLRKHGVRSIGRGPRRSTIDNPGQLTSRQVEILTLVAGQLTNAEIAARLFITAKTVEHHISLRSSASSASSPESSPPQRRSDSLAKIGAWTIRNIGDCARCDLGAPVAADERP